MVKGSPLVILLPLTDLRDPGVRLTREPRRPVRIDVPSDWCYRILRAPPPGGWNQRLRHASRPGLFPEPPEGLLWDEAILDDGSWSVWALPRLRLDQALGRLSSLVWARGRQVRVRPVPDSTSLGLADFPNLAPPHHRPVRIPWGDLRRAAIWAGALLLGFGLVGGTGWRVARTWKRLVTARVAAEKKVGALQEEMRVLQRVLDIHRKSAHPGIAPPPWLADLDALTRLLPEDTRLSDLEWTEQGLTLVLWTPNPEAIREILEASPEFRNVRLVGNLERRGDKVRLSLAMSSEVRA